MRDPIEKLQENPAFQKVDAKVNWSMAMIFGTVALLVVVALVKNVVLA